MGLQRMIMLLFASRTHQPLRQAYQIALITAKSKLSTPANPSVLGQANDLMSVDTEDHLLLTRQLDDEFQLLA